MSVRFKAGSFKYQSGFVRSILREKTGGEQTMLINPNKVYNSQDESSILAKTDIDFALVNAKSGQWESIDHALSAMGYQSIQ